MGWNGYEKPVGVRYQVSNYFQLPVGLGIGPNTTLPKHICIAGEVIQRHKGFVYVSTTTSNFPRLQNFSAFLSYEGVQIN